MLGTRDESEVLAQPLGKREAARTPKVVHRTTCVSSAIDVQKHRGIVNGKTKGIN
jgi:hypothetical protein